MRATLALLLGLATFVAAMPQPAAVLRGRITDVATGKPLAGVIVRLRDGRALFESTSSPDGTYALRGMPPGHYTFEAHHDGYAPISRFEEGAIPIGLRVTASTAGVVRDIALDPLVWIEGRAVDPDGRPLPGIAIYAMRPLDSEEGWPTFSPRGSVDAGADGAFRIQVPPGRYALKAYNGPRDRTSGDWYYPGVRDPRETTFVDAVAGAPPRAFVIPPRPYAPVEIEVLAPDGRPLPGATVFITHWQDHATDATMTESVITDARGIASFTYTGPGPHVAQAWYPASERRSSREPPATAIGSAEIEVSDAPFHGRIVTRATFEACAIVRGASLDQAKPVEVFAHELVENALDTQAARAEGRPGEKIVLREVPNPANIFASLPRMRSNVVRLDGEPDGCVDLVIGPEPTGSIRGAVDLPRGDWIPSILCSRGPQGRPGEAAIGAGAFSWMERSR